MDRIPKFTSVRYVLAVKDLEKSAHFYKNELGFSTWWSGEGWHFLKREKFMVMLGECPDDRSAFDTKNHSYFAYIEVDNIDSLHNEFISKDIEILGALDNQLMKRLITISTLISLRSILYCLKIYWRKFQSTHSESTFHFQVIFPSIYLL